PDNPNWHAWLGHPNQQFQSLIVPKSEIPECSICKECKIRSLPFSSKFKTVHRVLNAVHVDLGGPFLVQLPAGFTYFLTIVNQFSG
ncbi:uncharacterized protein VP01_6314g2, partial [Puccinia sorghi]